MCAQDCRTWLWGGKGNPDPAYDGEGQCSCICDDERWSDHNILGRASCVPMVAHLIFGWVGLVLSVAALCHAAYQLRRQLQFHAQDMLAPALPIEKCRRLVHLIAIAFNVFNIGLFCMVLGKEFRWSGVLLSAIQILPNICGVLGARIWMDTTRQGLTKQSPEILAVSSWLESPVGYFSSYTAVSIVPVIATILAAVDHSEAAIKMTAAGVLLVSSTISGTFYICGKSLVRVIDDSLEHRSKAIGIGGASVDHVLCADRVDRVGLVDHADHVDLVDKKVRLDHVDHGDDGDQALLRAKKKVKRTIGLFVRQLVAMVSVLGFAIFSKYGNAAPLLLFVAPLAIMPILKLIGGVQLFAGRSKLDASQGFRYSVGGHLRAFPTLKGLPNFPRTEIVVPIEQPSTQGPPPSTTHLFSTTQRTHVVPY